MSLMSYMYIASLNDLIQNSFPLPPERRKKYKAFVEEYWHWTTTERIPKLESLSDEDLSELAFRVYEVVEEKNSSF